jgi:hypothetical protein
MTPPNMRLRQWMKLDYVRPDKFLEGLKDMEQLPGFQALPQKIKNLRTNALKETLERRQAALFCYGLGQITGTEFGIAHAEESDYDFVMAYHDSGNLCFSPLQMKEFVPETVNPTAELQKELDKLQKYSNSEDLVVAIHLNRRFRFDLSAYDFSNLSIKDLWFFGRAEAEGNQWVIMGNMMQPEPKARYFTAP